MNAGRSMQRAILALPLASYSAVALDAQRVPLSYRIIVPCRKPADDRSMPVSPPTGPRHAARRTERATPLLASNGSASAARIPSMVRILIARLVRATERSAQYRGRSLARAMDQFVLECEFGRRALTAI